MPGAASRCSHTRHSGPDPSADWVGVCAGRTQRDCLSLSPPPPPPPLTGSVGPSLHVTDPAPSPPPPRCPSSPCSGDGSSQSERFPISFVHAGSCAAAGGRCTSCCSLLLRPPPGEPLAVQQPAAGRHLLLHLCSSSPFPPSPPALLTVLHVHPCPHLSPAVPTCPV